MIHKVYMKILHCLFTNYLLYFKIRAGVLCMPLERYNAQTKTSAITSTLYDEPVK